MQKVFQRKPTKSVSSLADLRRLIPKKKKGHQFYRMAAGPSTPWGRLEDSFNESTDAVTFYSSAIETNRAKH